MRLLPISKRELAMWFPQTRPGKTPEAFNVFYPGFEAHHAGETSHGWETEWDAVRGGVFAMVWKFEQPKGVSPDKSDDDEFTRLYLDIEKKIDVSACGIDITSDCRKLAGKARLRCREGVSGEDVSKQIRLMLNLVEAEVRGEDVESDSGTQEFALALLSEKNLKTGVQSNDRGRDVLTYDFEVNIPAILLAALAHASEVEPEKE